MPSTQLSGPIGPFLDSVQQRQVPVMVSGQCDYTVSTPVANPAAFDADIQARLLRAVNDVIAPKMASGELQFRNLGEGNLGNATYEIVAHSGLPQMGIQVGNLALRFAIDQHSPQQAQPEVRAHLNVGGFHVNASSKDGVNVGQLGNQLVNRAKSTAMWYVTFAVISAIIVGGAGWYIRHVIHKAISEPTPSQAAAAAWDGKAKLNCGGSDVVTIKGVTAKLSGTAITAAGSCNLTLIDCNITGDTGIEAIGSPTVTLQGGSITGTTGMAVHAMGSAIVTASGTKATGKTSATGSAKITGL